MLCVDDRCSALGLRVCEASTTLWVGKRVKDTIHVHNMTEGERTRWSQEIEKDADYLAVEYALESELSAGEVTVTGWAPDRKASGGTVRSPARSPVIWRSCLD